jgi:hypothetical protein
MKWQFMEWNNMSLPCEKFKRDPSSGKVMTAVFWDMKGAILVKIRKKGTTVNSEAYATTCKDSKSA